MRSGRESPSDSARAWTTGDGLAHTALYTDWCILRSVASGAITSHVASEARSSRRPPSPALRGLVRVVSHEQEPARIV